MTLSASFRILFLFLFVFCCFPHTPSPAQDSKQSDKNADVISPQEMGFTARTIQSDAGVIRYYLSSGGQPLDESQIKPLVLYLDGSGASPIFAGTKPRFGSTLMFAAEDFPVYHYAVISKPGIEFHEPGFRVESEEYDRTLSLAWRVDAASAVIDRLATEKFIDASHILVVGHSEGADVAPWLAAKNKHVTHVAGLAPGGLSQMLDFVLFVRKQVAAGKLTKEQGAQQIVELKTAYRDIFANPKATDKKWRGHSYLRWSSFFRPAMEAWCQIDKPIYLGYCRDDHNTPVECGEAIELEFIRLGKKNLTPKLWPTDHIFQSVPTDEKEEPVDYRTEVLKDVIDWAKRTR